MTWILGKLSQIKSKSFVSKHAVFMGVRDREIYSLLIIGFAKQASPHRLHGTYQRVLDIFAASTELKVR